MKPVVCRLLVALLALWSVSGQLAAVAAATKPNIVFFLIDDLGYADCGFNGGTEIKTPRIDQLAKAGAVLESLYVQPVCSPTRAALMTGRYAIRTGVYTIVRPHANWGLPLTERTLASALKDAGYETAITGKWHLGEFDRAYQPTARGFDHQYGHFFGMIDYFTHMRGDSHDWYRDDRELKEPGYSTHLLAREAVRLIAARDQAKPLFLYVPFNGVHSPHQVPEAYLADYAGLKGARRQLAGMLSAVDEAIGQIMDALTQQGMRDNTLVIFSSDNGGPKPGVNTPLRDYKGSIYEGGVRAAAFATWPGRIPAGVRVKEPIHTVDWYPTLVKLAGGSLEQANQLDGLDIWPVLATGATTPHESILLVQSPEKAAVRMGDWKLLMNAGRGASRNEQEDESVPAKKRPGKAKNRSTAADDFQLFNLAEDVSESVNVAEREPARLLAMQARLREWLKDAVPPGNLNEPSTPVGK